MNVSRDVVRHEPARPSVWSDELWPVLAGALLAVGVIGFAREAGLALLLLSMLGLWFLLALSLYCILSESPRAIERSVRWGWVSAVSLTVLVGVLLLFPLSGWPAATLVAISSPPCLSAAASWTRRRGARGRLPRRELL